MSKLLQLIQVVSVEQNSHIHQLFLEYVQLLHETADQEYGISIDINAIMQMFMLGVNAFYPPH